MPYDLIGVFLHLKGGMGGLFMEGEYSRIPYALEALPIIFILRAGASDDTPDHRLRFDPADGFTQNVSDVPAATAQYIPIRSEPPSPPKVHRYAFFSKKGSHPGVGHSSNQGGGTTDLIPADTAEHRVSISAGNSRSLPILPGRAGGLFMIQKRR